MQESLSPGATYWWLINALHFIPCKLTAINPALHKDYHSGAFFVDTSCQTGADLISPSVRLPEQEATVSRKSHENHAACNEQQPLPTRTELQGQIVVPLTPSTFAVVGACVLMCVCIKMFVCSLSTKGHTQPYSSAISQSRNKHPRDNSNSALAKIRENRKGTQSWQPELLAAAVQQSVKFLRINT